MNTEEKPGPAEWSEIAPEAHQPNLHWRGTAGWLIAGIAIGLLLFAAFAQLSRLNPLSHLAGSLFGRGTRIDTSSPAVVDRIRKLSRLESVVFSMDKIVEGERGNAYLPNFLVGEKILLIAHGDVTAGVDLEQLKPADLSVQGDSVRVKLPPAQVFSTRIDNAKTRIYSRTTGLLVPADPNLETEARQAAEQQIAQAALEDGVLDKATANARAGVQALLTGLGFKKVDVE